MTTKKNSNDNAIPKISYDDVIERSIFLPSAIPQCGACGETVFSEFLQSEAWPLFCIKCGNWYHHKCMPKTPDSESAICPQCDTGDFIRKSHFHCTKCGCVEIKKDTFLPNALCAKCGEKGSIAALTDIGVGEKGIFIIIGILSLVFLAIAALFIHSSVITKTAAIFTGLFALPWIFVFVAFAIGEVFPPLANSPLKRACGLKNRLLRDSKKFRNQNFVYRYARVYVWLLINSLEALLLLYIAVMAIKIYSS